VEREEKRREVNRQNSKEEKKRKRESLPAEHSLGISCEKNT
jgi:hypothetical protein